MSATCDTAAQQVDMRKTQLLTMENQKLREGLAHWGQIQLADSFC